MHRKVKADDELAVIVKAVDHTLRVAVPDEGGHVVAATGQDVCMVRRKLDSADGEGVLNQHHDRLVGGGPQIPHLDCIVCRRSRNEVLVLVEVHGQDFVGVSMDSLHIFSTAQIPNARSLVSAATSED